MFSAPAQSSPLYQRPSPRLPRYARVDAASLPPMRLTDRDKRILETVHAYDGVMADEQIGRLFFTGTTQRRVRTMLLYQHGYLNRPNRRQRAALPHMIYWLGERGAEFVAGLHGTALEEFAWKREPRWGMIEHDLIVNDMRIAFTQACQQQGFQFDEWIPQGEFWAHPDKIEYSLPDGTKATRRIRPDGYCAITRGDYTGKFLIEVDMATEDNPRIGREKILPGIAYVRSDAYKQRFGYHSGRWLFITTSDRRLHHMKRKAEAVAANDARLFFFTTFDRVTPETLLTTAVWWRGGDLQPTTLFK